MAERIRYKVRIHRYVYRKEGDPPPDPLFTAVERAALEAQGLDVPDDSTTTAYICGAADINKLLAAAPTLCNGLSLEGLAPDGYSWLESLHLRLDDLDSALRALADRATGAGTHGLNERVGVHVAGLGTLTLDTVRVVENYCTEELQKELDSGWRILAVCVQPNQRRPDYILGRSGVPRD